MQTTKLYARPVHGGFPIRVEHLPDGQSVFLVERNMKDVALYSSARQLLIALTGHPDGYHWTFDRYFRLGTYAKWNGEPFASIPELLGFDRATPFRPGPGLTVGIDLEKRGGEVLKLLYHGFGNKMRSAGYDPDEVLQEVYKGILIRNVGTCPFDPAKSSFGHYVHMICSCVVSNYHRKQSRVRSMEQVGAVGNNGEGVDVASDEARLPARTYFLGAEGEVLEKMAEKDLVTVIRRGPRHWTKDAELAWRIVPFVRQGMSRREIVVKVGVKKNAVSRALKVIRGAVRVWMNG